MYILVARHCTGIVYVKHRDIDEGQYVVENVVRSIRYSQDSHVGTGLYEINISNSSLMSYIFV